MKKIYMLTAAVVAVAAAMSSCSNSAKETAADTDGNEATEEVVEATNNTEADSTEASTQATPQMTPAEWNLKQGQDFLANLKENDKDVNFTESGLGYKAIKETRGLRPQPTSVAHVKYTGKHINGEVFDTSGDQVVTFPLNRVVPGFSEGITLMPKGSTYVLYLPANLAYGPNGTPGGPIGPNETLIFEVELVDFD